LLQDLEGLTQGSRGVAKLQNKDTLRKATQYQDRKGRLPVNSTAKISANLRLSVKNKPKDLIY